MTDAPAFINQEFTVLPPNGYVLPVDVMGGDEAVVEAARASYGRSYAQEAAAAGKKIPKNPRRLLRYLMRKGHWSPFEMTEIKFEVQAPLAVARQWFRHRAGHFNEISARYTTLEDIQYYPPIERMVENSSLNKQGSGERLEDDFVFRRRLDISIRTSSDEYRSLVECGLSKEVARMAMPVAQFTRWVWKVDGRNLLGFLAQRCDPHAQYEIRVYADAILKILEEWMPLTYEAFKDYSMDAVKLTGPELRVIHRMNSFQPGFWNEGFIRDSVKSTPDVEMYPGEITDFIDKVCRIFGPPHDL